MMHVSFAATARIEISLRDVIQDRCNGSDIRRGVTCAWLTSVEVERSGGMQIAKCHVIISSKSLK